VYLWHRADGVHLSNKFTIGLKQQEKLEVKFVQALTQLQLLWMIRIHQYNKEITHMNSQKLKLPSLSVYMHKK